MEKDPLFEISFIIFVLSFLFLLIIFYAYDIKEMNLEGQSEILNTNNITSIKLNTKVFSVSEGNKLVYIKLENCAPITMAAFQNNITNFSTLENKRVEIASHTKLGDMHLIDEIKILK